METIWKMLGHPFTWGLLLGLVFAAWAFFSGWSARRALKRDIRRLEGQCRDLEKHCQTAAELNAKSNQALLDENADLKTKNENLRISLAELKNKPDRAEVQKLYLLDKAVHLMNARAPGFAPLWEATLHEAQAELDKTSTGVIPWLRRIVHPFSGGAANTAPILPPPPETKPEG